MDSLLEIQRGVPPNAFVNKKNPYGFFEGVWVLVIFLSGLFLSARPSFFFFLFSLIILVVIGGGRPGAFGWRVEILERI